LIPIPIVNLDLSIKIKKSSFKYIENISCLIIGVKNDMKTLNIININTNKLTKFPEGNSEKFNDWFIIKSYNLICCISGNFISFYNISNGAHLTRINIFFQTDYDELIYNENINSMVLIYKSCIKIYKLTIYDDGIGIELIITHELKQRDEGCYLKVHNYFLSIKNSYMEIFNLNIDTINNLIIKKDLNLPFPAYSVNNFKSCYMKENTVYCISKEKNLHFINYTNGDIYKIITDAHETEIQGLKKIKIHSIRYFITYDKYIIKLWDIFEFKLINHFNLQNKSIEHLEFSNINGLIIVADNYNYLNSYKIDFI